MSEPRPVYETASTLRDEADTVAVIERAWRCKARKLPRAYRLDYALTRDGEVVAWAEVKCRGKRYDSYMLSLHKWTAALELAARTDLPALLVVRWPDGVHFAPFEDRVERVAIGGRTDRGDWQDVEPVVLLPSQRFRRVA